MAGRAKIIFRCVDKKSWRYFVLCGTFLLDDLFNFSMERRRFVQNYIPDNIIVYTKVVMDKSVAHPGYCSPFQFGVSPLQVWRYFFRCLSDYLYAPHERTFKRFVFQENFFVQILRGRRSGILFHRGCDVDTQATRAAPSTSFRMCGAM